MKGKNIIVLIIIIIIALLVVSPETLNTIKLKIKEPTVQPTVQEEFDKYGSSGSVSGGKQPS